jgi:DNA-binding SARP family transcriptional activator
LYFQLLGPLQVWRGTTRVDEALTARLPRELLAYMLLERDRLVPAERLLEVFWPDLAPGPAANNLQGVVVKLRRVLEPGLRRGRDSSHLLTEGDGYRLLADGLRVDLDEFEQSARTARAACRGGDLPAARTALERARDLYRGELVADLPYAEWAFMSREQFRETYLDVLATLGETQLELGVYHDALDVATQARAVDPVREASVRLQMRALAALGERAEALAVYDELARMLDEELGLTPAGETRALRGAILSGTFLPTGDAEPLPAPSLDLPLVGRDGALGLVLEACDAGTRPVFVHGAAGVGKTRLLEELLARLGPTALTGRAREGDVLFASVVRLVDRFLDTEPSAADLEALGPLGAPLAQGLPRLRERWPGCPPYAPLEGEAEEQRRRRALAAVLELTGARALVVDDLHWADEGSLDVLAELWKAGLLLVGAFRSDEVGAPLAGWLEALRNEPEAVLEVELEPLSDADVLTAVRAVAGLADPVPLSRRLHELTGGNPLFLAETLRGLREEGHVYRDPDGVWHASAELDELPLTGTLRDAILARAGRLDPRLREVLDAAVLLAPNGTTSALAAALEIEAAPLEQSLQELVARGWLQAAAPDGWEATHHLTAEALVAGLAPSHRRLLHRRAADALAASTPAEPVPVAADIVRHLEEGGGAPLALARWAVLAGEWAGERPSYRPAARYFALAEAQLEVLPEGEERRRIALAALEGLGTVLLPLRKSAEALAAFERALATTDVPADRARLLLGQARVHEGSGDYDAATALLDAAERLCSECAEPDAALLARIQTERADVHFWRGEYDPGERVAREAVARAGGTPWEKQALRALVNHLQKLGRQQEVVEITRRMRDVAEAAGDLHGLASAGVLLANGLVALGQLDESRKTLERSRDMFEQLGDLRVLAIVDTNLGIANLGLGALAGAEACARRATERAHEGGAPYTVAVAGLVLGQALMWRGRLEEAGGELAAAIATAAEIDARVVETQARVHRAQWHLLRGEPEQAGAELELAVAAGDDLGDGFCRREGRLLLGQIALSAGALELAGIHVRDGRQIAEEAQQALTVGRAERLLGGIASARGVAATAAEHLTASETIFRSAGAQLELGRTLLARAELARSSGGSETWRQPLLEARRLFRRTGARPLLKRAEELLAGG